MKDLMIYALKGQVRTGKTNILRNLIVMLINNGSFKVKSVYRYREKRVVKVDYEKTKKYLLKVTFRAPSDYGVVFEYNGVLFAIITAGDGVSFLSKFYDVIIKEYNFNLLVCAIHNTWEMITYIKTITKNIDMIDSVNLKEENLRIESNKKIAFELYNKILNFFKIK